MALATLTIDINAKLANIERDLGKVSHMAEASAKRMESSFAAAGTALAGIAGALSLGALAAQVKSIIDLGDEMNDLAQKVGIGVKELSSWKLAAEQSGTSLEAVSKGVKGLSQYMLENGDALKAAGVTARDSNGAMLQLADVFSAMPDGVEKTALAVKLFGKAGMDMIPMLNLGSAGLAEAQEKSRVYGERMALLAPQADKFNDLLAEMAMHTQATGISIATTLLPAMTEIAEAMNMAAQEGGALKAAWVGLGGVGAQVFNPLLAIMKTVGANAHELVADFNEAMAKVTAGNVSQNFYQTAIAERQQAQKIYGEISALGNGLGLDSQGQSSGGAAPADFASRQLAARKQACVAMKGKWNAATGACDIGGAAAGGGSAKPPKASGSVEDYADRINRAVAGAINDNAVTKSRELAAQIEALDRLFFDAGLDVDIYTAALAKLTGQSEAAGKESTRLNDLLAATPTAQIEAAQQDMLLLANALEVGRINEEQYLEAVNARLGLVAEKAAEVNDVAQQLGMTFASAFEDAIVEGKEFSDVLKGLLKDIERIVVRKTITEPMANAVSGMLDGFDAGGLLKGLFGGGRAAGGPVSPGQYYVVGEKGPEVLVPNVPGTVIQNGALAGAAPITVTQHINIDARSDVATIRMAMMQAQANAVAAITNASRRGG